MTHGSAETIFIMGPLRIQKRLLSYKKLKVVSNHVKAKGLMSLMSIDGDKLYPRNQKKHIMGKYPGILEFRVAQIK